MCLSAFQKFCQPINAPFSSWLFLQGQSGLYHHQRLGSGVSSNGSRSTQGQPLTQSPKHYFTQKKKIQFYS